MLFKLSSMTFGLKVEPNVGWKLAADPRPTTLRSLKSTPSSRDWIFDCSFLRRKTNIRHHQKCWKKKILLLDHGSQRLLKVKRTIANGDRDLRARIR